MMRKGVSPVVATVLLLVITVLLASIIMTIIVPFVQDQLGQSKECAAALDSISFADSRFNCYTGFNGFSLSVKKPGITGARVSLIDLNENADVFLIKQGATYPDSPGAIALKNVGENFAPAANPNILSFTNGVGQRTYVAKKAYARAEVAPIVTSGRTCAVTDTIEFTACPATGVDLGS